MNPFENMMGGQNEGTNLFSILLNVAFGFVAGLIIFLGFKEVLELGTKYAQDLLSLIGYGDQLSSFGIATSAAPFVVIAPIAGMVVKELSAVRSLKSFGFFAAAVIIGIVIAFFIKGNLI